MKKSVIFVLTLVLAICLPLHLNADNDRVITFDRLPATAQAMLKQNFADKTPLAITADRDDNQLEIIIEYEDGKYKKDIIGLADNVTYLVEDLETSDVDPYHYEVNWNPKMWNFAEPAIID
jgi:hypothetical protein